jgi:hypothetical protein
MRGFLTSPSTGLQRTFIVTVNDIIYDIVASYQGSKLGQFKGFSMEEIEVNIIASEFLRFFCNSSQIFQDSDLIMSIMRRKQSHFFGNITVK